MKTMILFCLVISLAASTHSTADAQPLLRTEHAKMCTYSNGQWGSWSEEWAPVTAKFRFTQVDVFALVFRAELTLEGLSVNSRFTYLGYDSDNNWFKYREVDGSDIICIEGVKMSYLANQGWPDYNVKIYIWSIKNKIGVVFD